ncbi:hypothetical protein M0R19_05205 [Candidatus Pacearchaeota archaeon]|jgi:hypothetical protein|nr:hypothetical protein [Candidatus Pacearchaeota archaeon]
MIKLKELTVEKRFESVFIALMDLCIPKEKSLDFIVHWFQHILEDDNFLTDKLFDSWSTLINLGIEKDKVISILENNFLYFFSNDYTLLQEAFDTSEVICCKGEEKE